MKQKFFNFFVASLTIIGGFVFYSCEKDDSQEKELNSVVVLNFDSQDNKPQKIKAYLKYTNNALKIVSDDLVEIKAKDKSTKEEVSVFVLKDSNKNKKKIDSSKRLPLAMSLYASSEDGGCDWGIRRGYGYYGGCFVWGTIITGNNCERYFSPSSGYNPGFESICPGFGGAFAKDFNEKITLLK